MVIPNSESEDSSLVAEAKLLGAEPVPEEEPEEEHEMSEAWKGTKTIKDALGDGKIDFHNDLAKVKFVDLVGSQFILKQIKIIPDWDGRFGASDFALILIERSDGSHCTTLGGGRAIMNQCKKLLHERVLPVKVKLNMAPGIEGEYYIFE